MGGFVHPDFDRLLVWVGEEPAGAACTYVLDGVLGIAGTSTLPAFRRRGVQQAVVFGRPTGAGLRNEEVTACVLGSPGITESDLVRFCRTALSMWQVPKRIFVVDIIPTNERGKVSRRELARRFSEGH